MKERMLTLFLLLYLFSNAYTQTAEEYNKLGIERGEVEKYKEAFDLFTKSIEVDSTYSKAYYNRGLAEYNLVREGYYYHLGNPEIYFMQYPREYMNSISDFTKAIELKPNYSDAYYNRGIAYKNMREYFKAISDLTKYISLKPNDEDGYYERGLDYYDLKDYPNAVLDFTKVIKINSKNEDAYYIRGIAYYILGKEKKACEDWDKVTSHRKDDAEELKATFCK
jgi:tetratricopeptide (TPR) repeat protein